MQNFTTGYFNKFNKAHTNTLQEIKPIEPVKMSDYDLMKIQLEEKALKRDRNKEKKDKQELFNLQLKEDQQRFKIMKDREKEREKLNNLAKQKESFQKLAGKESPNKQKQPAFFFGRSPNPDLENLYKTPPPNPNLEERKLSEGNQFPSPWKTPEHEENGTYQCPYCEHKPYVYHKALLTHLETKHSDIK